MMDQEIEPTLHDVIRLMQTGFDNLENQMFETNRRLGSLESTVEDIREDVVAIGKAVDKDAEVIIDHGRRIKKLEQVIT